MSSTVALTPESEVDAVCPACGQPDIRSGARFCDGCGQDLTAPADAAPALPAPSRPAPALRLAPAGVLPLLARRWELVATPDPAQAGPGEALPADLRVLLFALDGDEAVIGRRSGRPDDAAVALPDPGISRRHARVERRPDGGIELTDLGSTNGTRLNGAPMQAHVAVPLGERDQVTLGCWTRLSLRPR